MSVLLLLVSVLLLLICREGGMRGVDRDDNVCEDDKLG